MLHFTIAVVCGACSWSCMSTNCVVCTVKWKTFCVAGNKTKIKNEPRSSISLMRHVTPFRFVQAAGRFCPQLFAPLSEIFSSRIHSFCVGCLPAVGWGCREGEGEGDCNGHIFTCHVVFDLTVIVPKKYLLLIEEAQHRAEGQGQAKSIYFDGGWLSQKAKTSLKTYLPFLPSI